METLKEQLLELENQFNEVADWLLTNNMLHPEWDNKTKNFNELDEQIINLIQQTK